MPRHSPYALLRLNYLSILDTIWFFVSRLNCCVILAVFFGKIVSFTLTEKPDFFDRFRSFDILFPFTLSVMYVTQILSNSYDFSYSVFNEHSAKC